MNEQEHIHYCLKQIEKKLGWGTSEHWHSDVFKELSDNIFSEVGVMLSPTTLKRLWGKVNYNGAPSISTLNALAQFAGYINWRDFKSNASIPNSILKSKNPVSKISRKKTFLIAAVVIFAISIVSLINLANLGSAPVNLAFASKPVATGVPNSVVFTFDPIYSDSGRIQLFWDPSKTIFLKQEQKTATGIYYIPGYFNASLIVDGNTINTHDVFITSEGWMATIDYLPVPKYINGLSFNTILELPESVENEIIASENPVSITYHYVEDLEYIDGDNFSIDTRLKTLWSDKWAVCQKTQIVLLGTKGAMIIPFSIPGCVSDINLMLNDFYLNGKEHNLSSFGVDFSEAKNIRISNENKLMRISVEDKKIFEGPYKATMGRLIGLRYRYFGVGIVESLVISQDGRIVISSGDRMDVARN